MPVEDRLGQYIKQTEQAINGRKEHAMRALDLTVPQYAALLTLSGTEGMSGAKLARRCMVTPQTMTTILSNLSAKGLVSRTESPDHTRVLITRLTPAGKRKLKQADAKAVAIERFLAEEFTPDEAEELRSLLTRASNRLAQFRQPEKKG
ncbi:transcriptional regulator, MarR family [Stackebrandtia nassauensis DSM 44728]|uniref:Transcriptional regulator, MarR family n=2 Tax=Stackebrandtia TaxID=283810 RepID=D3Q629_STANL|nr:transcriptional regulator, MarR family [Stackebrandtia nassauensis DSM 44728]